MYAVSSQGLSLILDHRANSLTTDHLTIAVKVTRTVSEGGIIRKTTLFNGCYLLK